MSHFAVLVIGDDYEAQLAPYHEFECTGMDDEYVQNLDRLPEAREQYAKEARNQSLADFIAGWYGVSLLGPDEDPDLGDRHKYGWVRVDANGDVIEFIDRTNPNSKWDWYSVGGRWRGFFQVKAGTVAVVGRPGVFDNAPEFNADEIRRGDVDFAAMRSVAEVKAELDYTLYEDAIDGTPEPDTWDAVRERHPEDNAARKEYREQARIIALDKADLMPWFKSLEDVYGGGREAFIARAVATVAVPFAIVMDGQWIAKGDMGWFGMSDDKVSQDEWNQRVQDIYDSLPDDTMLTLVDCHV